MTNLNKLQELIASELHIDILIDEVKNRSDDVLNYLSEYEIINYLINLGHRIDELQDISDYTDRELLEEVQKRELI